MLAFVVPTMGRFVYTPILPLMQAEGSLSLVAAGWLAGTNHVGYLIGAVTATRLPWSERAVLRIGLIGVAASVTAMAIPGPLAGWFVWRWAAGVFAAWALIHTSAWGLRHAVAAAHPEWGGWIFAGSGIGLIASGLVCAVLIATGGTASVAWLVNGAGLLAIGALLWTRGGDAGHHAPSNARAGEATDPAIARLVLSYGLGGFGYVTAATFLPVLARGVLGNGIGYTLFWPLFGIAALVSLMVASPIGVRVGDARAYRWSLAVMAAGNTAMAAMSAAWALALGTVAIGGTFMVLTLLGLREARRRVPPEAATRVIGKMTIAWAVGQCVGPVVSAYLAGDDGRFTGALALAALALAAAVVLTPASAAPQRPAH